MTALDIFSAGIDAASGGTITAGLGAGMYAVTPALGDNHPRDRHPDGHSLDLVLGPTADPTKVLAWVAALPEVERVVVCDDGTFHLDFDPKAATVDLSGCPKPRRKTTNPDAEPVE